MFSVLEYIPRTRIVGSCGNSVLTFNFIFSCQYDTHLCIFQCNCYLYFTLYILDGIFTMFSLERHKREYFLPFPLVPTFLIQWIVSNPLPPVKKPIKPITFVQWLIFFPSFTYTGNAWSFFTFSKHSWPWNYSSVWESRTLLTSMACRPSRGPCGGWPTSRRVRGGAHTLLSQSHSTFVGSTCQVSLK